MTRGTNLVEKFRAQAQYNKQSMFIGKVWDSDNRPAGVAIWLYGKGEKTKIRPPVAEAASLDQLYGRR